jgi:hypothetical protein
MATKPAMNLDSLIEMFSSASAQQSEQLRKAVGEATLGALQGRELSLQNIRTALKTVAQAASTGIAKNPGPAVDVEAMLNQAIAGMDDALLKAVDANRVALQQFVDQGVDLQEKHLSKALTDLEQLEDTLFASLKNAAESAGAQLAAPWQQVLEKFQVSGSSTGVQAAQTIEQLTEQMQTAMRDSRQAGLQAAQALAQSYSALVSGVLIGMSDALRQGMGAKPAGGSSRRR